MESILLKASRVFDDVAERAVEHAYVMIDGDTIVATSVAAEALGRHDLGVLAPGKAADLLAVRGNPLQDIRDLANTRLVVARSHVMDGSPVEFALQTIGIQ